MYVNLSSYLCWTWSTFRLIKLAWSALSHTETKVLRATHLDPMSSDSCWLRPSSKIFGAFVVVVVGLIGISSLDGRASWAHQVVLLLGRESKLGLLYDLDDLIETRHFLGIRPGLDYCRRTVRIVLAGRRIQIRLTLIHERSPRFHGFGVWYHNTSSLRSCS